MSPRTRSTLAALAACVLAVSTATTRAALTFLPGSSSAVAQHFVNEAGSHTDQSLVVQSTTTPGFPGSPTSFSQTVPLSLNPDPVSNPSTTTARAAIGQYTTPSRAMLSWGPASGLNQVDPFHINNYNSALSINFDYTWRVDNATAGPPVSYQFNVPVAGSIGTNGFVRVYVGANWFVNGVQRYSWNNIGAPFTVSGTAQSFFTNISSPAFSESFLALGPGSTLRMNGFAVFYANNEEAPSTVFFPFDQQREDPTQQTFNGTPYLTGFNFEEVVPEPTALTLLTLATTPLLLRRQRRPQ